jgi:polysaccharide biosynthesis protein PslH
VASKRRVFLLAVLETPPTPEALKAAATLAERVEWTVMRQERSLQRIRTWVRHLTAGHPLATWSYCPPVLADKLAALVRQERVDIVQIEHSFLAPYVLAVAGTRCRTVLDLHNHGESQYRTMLQMQCEPAQRWVWMAKAALMQGWEARFAARFDRCLAVSPVEARTLAQAAGRPVDLLANGVDTTALQPLPPTQGHRLLFVGNLQYPPNRDAVDWLARDILPLVRRDIEDAELIVVGDHKGRPDCPSAGLTLLGQVDDLLPCY